MLKSETKEFGGLQVTSTQFGAMKAYKLFTRLCRLAAPVIGSLASGLNGQTDVGGLAGALSELFGQLDDTQAEDLALQLLASTQVKVTRGMITLDTKPMIDAAFEGNFGAMLSAMRLAVEVNYGDFIASALAAARARKAAAEAAKAVAKAIPEATPVAPA